MKACKECGRLRETAEAQLKNVFERIDHRLYLWQFGDAHGIEGKAPTFNEVWEWAQKLKKVMEEL